jgi:hypothetical protein
MLASFEYNCEAVWWLQPAMVHAGTSVLLLFLYLYSHAPALHIVCGHQQASCNEWSPDLCHLALVGAVVVSCKPMCLQQLQGVPHKPDKLQYMGELTRCSGSTPNPPCDIWLKFCANRTPPAICG